MKIDEALEKKYCSLERTEIKMFENEQYFRYFEVEIENVNLNTLSG
jgi:hypothetical protein